jgi:hypothetical protein
MIPELFERSPAAGATLTLSLLAALWVVQRVVRTTAQSVGSFFTWVTDERARIVRFCYTLAAVLTISGTSAIGTGISRINSAPDKQMTDEERRQKFMSDLAVKMAGTSNKDCLESLRALATSYDSRTIPTTPIPDPTAARPALVDARRFQVDQPTPEISADHPRGAPLVTGGIGALIIALALGVRTAHKYD